METVYMKRQKLFSGKYKKKNMMSFSSSGLAQIVLIAIENMKWATLWENVCEAYVNTE